MPIIGVIVVSPPSRESVDIPSQPQDGWVRTLIVSYVGEKTSLFKELHWQFDTLITVVPSANSAPS